MSGAAIREARDVLQITEYANGYSAVDMLRAQVASLMAEVEIREQTLMRQVLDAERFDRKFGLSLPGDSALAVILGGFEQTLARSGE